MSSPTGDFRPSTTARELADALRAGVAAHRVETPGVAEGDAARLRDLGALDELPPVVQPGLHAPVVRAGRRVLRALARPWFAAQAIFNREMARRVGDLAASAHDVERRLPRLEQSLADLDERLRRVEAPGARPRGAAAVEDRGATALALQRMFVHSRMPRPPARVLHVGDAGSEVAVELASFGFDVVTADAGALETDSRHLRRARARPGALPFADAAFDVVFRLWTLDDAPEAAGQGLEEAVRVLRPGGRLLTAIPAGAGGSFAAAPIATAGRPRLHVAETVVVTRRDGVWSAAAGAGDAGVAPDGDGDGDGFRLIDARRADAPAR